MLTAASLCVTSAISIRDAAWPDVKHLANLCTDTFYGTHNIKNGPVIYLQRKRVLARVKQQIGARIEEASMCERRLLVAESTSRVPVGMVDIAVHLYDTYTERFELQATEIPAGGDYRFAWRPYVTSLAVQPTWRRRGVASLLMSSAEGVVVSWECEPEVMLEVEANNDVALKFYRRNGYRVMDSGAALLASTAHTQTVVRAGLWWSRRPVAKLTMSKALYL